MSISQVSRDSTFDMRLSLTSFELSTHLVLSFKFCEFPNHSTFIVLISHESCSATFVSIEAQSRVLSLVGPSGLEPPTSCLSGTRSNLLSYEPMWLVSDLRHLNLFTSLFRKASLLTFFSKKVSGGDEGIRLSRELRAQSFAALTIINRHSLPLLLRIPS